jgi:AbiV family abortive infection protein
MSDQKLTPYKGLLSSAEVAAGMNAANRNAKRLADDARILLDKGRIPTAASLAALAIEEAGKVTILRQIALVTSQKDAAKAWKPYRRHTDKNNMWPFPQMVSGGARQLEDFRSLVAPDAEHPQLLDQLKQLGFYTDTYKRGHWSCPEEVIDRKLADSLVQTAELLASDKVVTAEEIDLWAKHLGPVWGKSYEWMQKALVDWYSEMQQRGLAPAGANKMQVFVSRKASP